MKIDDKLLLENSTNLSVLYVENDSSLKEHTIKLLSKFFTSIDLAEDGVVGYGKYKTYFNETNTNYDMVITNIHMPNMDGIHMCQKIGQIDPEQVIVFINTDNEVEYLNHAIELGIHGFLTKPINITTLKHVLYKVTQKISDKKLIQNHYEQIEELNMLNINKKDASQFTSSKDIIEELEYDKEKISRLWTEKELVRERLASHFIDTEFFRSHYAIKVIEYFLGVIKEENHPGNCPVIFIMLDFFKNKHLPLKDIFIICVTFKNIVLAYIFNRFSFNNLLFHDISMILDANFEGVIIDYLKIPYSNKSTQLEQKNNEEMQLATHEVENTIYTEYVLEHDIYELQDLEEDIDTLAISVTESASSLVTHLNDLGQLINRYGKILSNYPIFSELGTCILKLGTNFSFNAQLLFDDNVKMSNIAVLLEGFVNDLIMWRKEIFENNIANPYFLNQSFFSNVDTIIMYIEHDDSMVSSEEDLDDMFF